MKRYIRTKNGNRFVRLQNGIIFDLEHLPTGIWFDGENIKDDESWDSANIFTNDFAKESDTIEKLIEDNDLTDLGFWKDIAYKDEADINITELYTKQGDNYILVAHKENGEWRVI